MKRALIVVGSVVLTLLLPLVMVGALLALSGDAPSPSQAALDEVPHEFIGLYQAAAGTCEGLDWTVLAAIHKVETTFGRGGEVSSAGARGPMQFMPSTFDAYGIDGDGDGRADISDVEDAIFSAASYLCANGAGDPQRLADAIWHYNHSDTYVSDVLILAASYGAPARGGYESDLLAAEILANPQISLTSNARADVQAGQTDARLLTVLAELGRRFSVGISRIFPTTEQSIYVAGTDSISNHFYGRAVDISYVDGRPVSAANMSARRLVTFLSTLPPELRPTEIGHPFADLEVPGGFTDAAHADHLHIGFDHPGG